MAVYLALRQQRAGSEDLTASHPPELPAHRLERLLLTRECQEPAKLLHEANIILLVSLASPTDQQ